MSGKRLTAAEKFERYLAKVDFQHKFVNVKKRLEYHKEIESPTFFARNIPFSLNLFLKEGDIVCDLIYEVDDDDEDEFYLNLEYTLSLITPSKTVQSEAISHTLDRNNCLKTVSSLSELFPGEKILVNDAITIKISLWVDEPRGIEDYEPPKEKVRESLEIEGNEVHAEESERLLDSGDFSDVTFVVSADSSKVKAHKAILAAHSDVFARMLTSDMKEAKDNEIRIDDMGATSLKLMLRHIYTGQLRFPKGVKIDLKICQELANAGEKYNLQNLKEYAAMAMTEFVSLANAWELFVFAKRLKAEDATYVLTSYYVENVRKIMKMV